MDLSEGEFCEAVRVVSRKSTAYNTPSTAHIIDGAANSNELG